MSSERYSDYRAKSAYERDKWLYGYKVGAVGNVAPHLIVDGEIDDDGELNYEAIPYVHDTLCRNTHRVDHTNRPIYENDIVCVRNEFGEQEGPVGIVRYGQYRDNDQPKAYNLGFWIDWQNEELPGLWRVELLFFTKERPLYVIGNIIDSPGILSRYAPLKPVTVEDTIQYLTQRAAQSPMAEKQYYRVAVDALTKSRTEQGGQEASA